MAAALAARRLASASEAIKPLRERETAAAAVTHGLNIEKDRLERSLEGAAAEAQRLVAEIERIGVDDARERQIGEDAAAAIARLEGEAAQARERAAAALRQAAAARGGALAGAEADRAAADGALEVLAARIAAAQARRAEVASRPDLDEARSRLARTARALAQARSEQEARGDGGASAAAAAAEALAAAASRLDEVRASLATAETQRSAAAEEEARGEASRREVEAELAKLLAEARGLAQLSAAPAASPYPAAMESTAPERGLEAALAAALGDDLDAALDAKAAAFRAGASAQPPARPKGATPLAPLVVAPGQLAARLAFVALVEAADGPRLQKSLFPGARLVSRQGDLWRWDGLTVKAGAPRAAQARFEQKARLTDIEAQIEKVRPKAAATKSRCEAASVRLAASAEAVRLARQAIAAAEPEAQAKREEVERREREGARREAQFNSLAETISRFGLELEEAQIAVAALEREAAEPGEDLTGSLEEARVAAQSAREAASTARAARDGAARDLEQSSARLLAVEAEVVEWRGRSTAAADRRTALSKALEKANRGLAAARCRAARGRRSPPRPDRQGRRRRSGSGRRRRRPRRRRERAVRSGSREPGRRGRRRRRPRVCGHLRRAPGSDPGAPRSSARLRSARLLASRPGLGAAVAASGARPLGDLHDAEARLAELTRAREAIGPVNLLAEGEAADLAERVEALRKERADLAGALSRLRQGIEELQSRGGASGAGAAFAVIDGHFRALFTTLFEGGKAELRLVEADDPLEAGL